MPEITLTVRHASGLHARPAALFVQAATQFGSDIAVTHGERAVKAVFVAAVIAMGIKLFLG